MYQPILQSESSGKGEIPRNYIIQDGKINKAIYGNPYVENYTLEEKEGYALLTRKVGSGKVAFENVDFSSYEALIMVYRNLGTGASASIMVTDYLSAESSRAIQHTENPTIHGACTIVLSPQAKGIHYLIPNMWYQNSSLEIIDLVLI